MIEQTKIRSLNYLGVALIYSSFRTNSLILFNNFGSNSIPQCPMFSINKGFTGLLAHS